MLPYMLPESLSRNPSLRLRRLLFLLQAAVRAVVVVVQQYVAVEKVEVVDEELTKKSIPCLPEALLTFAMSSKDVAAIKAGNRANNTHFIFVSGLWTTALITIYILSFIVLA